MRSNLQICLALMKADSEDDVVSVLQEEGYWDDATAWRLLGDNENNYASIGNQQSEAVAALIEKLVNSIDARLTDACLRAGTDPAGPEAPKSVREAVARFFECKTGDLSESDGNIAQWLDGKATDQGRQLTLAATGFPAEEGRPCLSIADDGEGQEPDRFPDTFMSIQASNKLRIPFVQGKFNMGGTGALQFCSPKHNLQLIVSRRDQTLVSDGAPTRASQWGFTVVRRRWPDDGSRSSVFAYLAPCRAAGVSSAQPGGVLAFTADSLEIFPEINKNVRGAYQRSSTHGSLVKLYEYDLGPYRTNLIRQLLGRLELGLPEAALPIRVFECRPRYSGHHGSFSTNVLGLAARLEKDKATNLEPDFPSGAVLNVAGSKLKVRVFAFKPGKAKDYRHWKHCVVFSVNGQAHATFSADFFRRKTVGMSYLADSLLVLVDCSAIQGQDRENLFMNSRDRLRDSDLGTQLVRDLQQLLRDDAALRALRNSRRQAEIAEKLADDKPLAEALESIIRSSPSLARLFALGGKVPSPFPPGGGSGGGQSAEFHGKTYPTFFRFRGTEGGQALVRDVHLGGQTRLAIETDAEDQYFLRDVDTGVTRLLVVTDDGCEEVEDWVLKGPKDGIASLTLSWLPGDPVAGEELRLRLETTDPSRIDAFESDVILRVRPPEEGSSGGGGRRKTSNKGEGGAGGGSSLHLPTIKEVTKEEWAKFECNESRALWVKGAGIDDSEEGQPSVDQATQLYDFFVNVDNKYLKSAQKDSKVDPKLLKTKFVYGLVLIAVALLQAPPIASPEEAESTAADSDSGQIEGVIDLTCTALAPMLIPLLDTIGGLEADELS